MQIDPTKPPTGKKWRLSIFEIALAHASAERNLRSGFPYCGYYESRQYRAVRWFLLPEAGLRQRLDGLSCLSAAASHQPLLSFLPTENGNYTDFLFIVLVRAAAPTMLPPALPASIGRSQGSCWEDAESVPGCRIYSAPARFQLIYKQSQPGRLLQICNLQRLRWHPPPGFAQSLRSCNPQLTRTDICRNLWPQRCRSELLSLLTGSAGAAPRCR